MHWYTDVLKKYAVFDGRARREEFWMFTLFNLIISLGIALIAAPLYLLYSLIVLLPHLAVTVRRLHDTARNGWWLLIVLIPLVGPIMILVFTALDSDPEENQYGANPKLRSAA
jgi:uncharacterized membrane protein YhaH (DUF805 family)